MRIITILVFITIYLIPSTGYGDWIEDFEINTAAQGIEVAVSGALELGRSPYEILEHGLLNLDNNPQRVLKALYCEGVDGEDIKKASNELDISDLILVSAFEKSIAECGDAVADSQAYTPIKVSFSGLPSISSKTTSRLSSPSTF